MNSYKTYYYVCGVLVLCAGVLLWNVFQPQSFQSVFYFLNVGQADASLITRGSLSVLVDGGKDKNIITNLESILPSSRKRIDLIFISHPEQDHIGGLFDVLDRYDVGCIFHSDVHAPLWDEFEKKALRNTTCILTLEAGDRVRVGDLVASVVWPVSRIVASEKFSTNEQSLVVRFADVHTSALFAGDVSAKVETIIKNIFPIRSDILKVPHHGSKFSSSEAFLSMVHPFISVIEVGKNSYGHPTQDVLDRVAHSGSQIFRTDTNGIIKIYFENGALVVGTK